MGRHEDARPVTRRSVVAVPTIEITPPGRWVSLGLSDLWRSRELLYFLAWRDVKVRYKQAFFGFAWAVLQPVLMMAIFTVFLGRVAHVSSEGFPYPVFVFCGLLPWSYFANAVTDASQSLVTNTTLVSKVYLPRLLVPFASLLAWLPDLGVATGVLVAVMAVYGVVPARTAFLVPVFALFGIFCAAGVATWLSALNVAYRDVRYAVPFLVQIWMFATPVVYPATAVSARYRVIYGLNPMTGVIAGFRWAVLGAGRPALGTILVSLAVSSVVLVTGLAYFRRVERFFADVI
jgi:lipopolysaccharide transport system permease protein